MEYGYFDSEVTGFEDSTGMPIFDRAQNSQFMADMYASLITSGVYPNPSSNLQVMERDDNVLGVKVMPGRLWIKGRFATEDEPTVLAAPTASTTANRIDIVVGELNFVDRKIELKYVVGGAAAPALVRNSDSYQIQLAQITVPKNATRISQSNILDTRANTALCGYVVGVITQIDGETLFVQLKSMIDKEEEYLNAQNDKISGMIQDIQNQGFIGISTNYEEIGGTVFDAINAANNICSNYGFASMLKADGSPAAYEPYALTGTEDLGFNTITPTDGIYSLSDGKVVVSQTGLYLITVTALLTKNTEPFVLAFANGNNTGVGFGMAAPVGLSSGISTSVLYPIDQINGVDNVIRIQARRAKSTTFRIENFYLSLLKLR